MGVRRSNHVSVALNSLGRVREIMRSRAQRKFQLKPADSALLGRARSRVRVFFIARRRERAYKANSSLNRRRLRTNDWTSACLP